MALSALEPQTAWSARLLTAADLAVLPRDLPSGWVSYELDRGRLRVMSPPTEIHGALQLAIASEWRIQGQQRGFGKARTETGVLLSRDPDTLLVPDALFIRAASLPTQRSPEGYLLTVPDLVLEVRSPSNRAGELARKVTQYLAAGVQQVWVADPAARSITVHDGSQAAEPRVYGEGERVSAGEIIPGFSLAVADAFEG